MKKQEFCDIVITLERNCLCTSSHKNSITTTRVQAIISIQMNLKIHIKLDVTNVLVKY